MSIKVVGCNSYPGSCVWFCGEFWRVLGCHWKHNNTQYCGSWGGDLLPGVKTRVSLVVIKGWPVGSVRWSIGQSGREGWRHLATRREDRRLCKKESQEKVKKKWAFSYKKSRKKSVFCDFFSLTFMTERKPFFFNFSPDFLFSERLRCQVMTHGWTRWAGNWGN